MSRQGKNHGYNTSRDYFLGNISCNFSICPANKRNFCVMSSAIVIDAGGRCKTGIDLVAAIKPKKLKVDGD